MNRYSDIKVTATGKGRVNSGLGEHRLTKEVQTKRGKSPPVRKRVPKDHPIRHPRPPSPSAQAGGDGVSGQPEVATPRLSVHANALSSRAAEKSIDGPSGSSGVVGSSMAVNHNSVDNSGRSGSLSHSDVRENTPALGSGSDEESGLLAGNYEDEEDPSLVSESCETDGVMSYATYTESTDSAFEWIPEGEYEPSKLPYGHPFLPYSDLARQSAIGAFRQHMEAGGDERSTGMRSAPPSLAGFTRKRPRGNTHGQGSLDEEEEEEEDEQQRGHGLSKKRAKVDSKELTFACPFLKKDLRRYGSCCSYQLRRIRDVKQHLGRKHSLPPYCPTCYMEFADEDERDEHVRVRQCSEQSRATQKPEGMTDAQKRQLGKKSLPSQTPPEQWFAIFDILFPGQQRPQSPYMTMDRSMLRAAIAYQDYLEERGVDFLANILAQQGVLSSHVPNLRQDLATFHRQVIREGIRDIFDHWTNRPNPGASSTASLVTTTTPTIASSDVSQENPREFAQIAGFAPSMSSFGNQSLSSPTYTDPLFNSVFDAHGHGFIGQFGGSNLSNDLDIIYSTMQGVEITGGVPDMNIFSGGTWIIPDQSGPS